MADEPTVDLQRRAWHEAGHAVIGCVLGIQILLATIEPGEGRLGRVERLAAQEVSRHDQILWYLAGPLAEAMQLGDDDREHDDFGEVWEHLVYLHEDYGLCGFFC